MIPTLADISEIDESILDEALLTAYAIRGDELKENFYDFFVEFWPVVSNEPLLSNWHIEKLCEVAQDNVMRVIRREPKKYDVPINVPPGSTKSKIFSIMLNAWAWTSAPWLVFITASHSRELALDFAVETRKIIKSEEYQTYFPNAVELLNYDDKKSGFGNSAGGRRISCSVGSKITGKHAHIIVLDDLIDPKSAASEADLKSVRDWLKKTIPSRKINKDVTVTFLIMQRLSEMDPTGIWLDDAKNGKRLFHICIPGETKEINNVKPKEWIKYYKNDLMDINRLNWRHLKDFKIDHGRREYAGQILQNPSAIEGNVFLREYWKFYNELSQTRSVTYQSWDTAFKKGEENDYSCCTTWRVYPNGYYLVDLWMKKVETPELKKMIILKNSQFKPHQVLIEDKASGTTSIQELRKENRINIVPIDPYKDKISRANDAVPTIEAGNVYLPENASWTADFIDRFAAFPDGKNDDDVDSVTQFLNYIRLNQTGGVYRSRKPTPKLRGY